MNNTKVKEIIKFSFYKNIQNKWFLIFNAITLASIVIMLNWSSVLSLFEINDEPDNFEIAVLDKANLVFDSFKENFDSLATTKNFKEDTNYTKFNVERINENNYNAETIPDDFVLIEILPDDVEGFKTSVISKEGINTYIYEPIITTLSSTRNDILSQKYNVTSSTLSTLQKELSIERILLSVDADNSAEKELIKLFSSAITYILTILIFSKMANEIAQEKQSKSSEYILTTVSAKEYLFAKIFSNIAILILQGLLLFVYYFIAVGIMNILQIATTDLTLSTGLLSSSLSLDLVLYVVALLTYSILTLILLCIIQATLSAKTASISEAGNTVSLLVSVMMASYIATLYLITPYTKVSGLLYILSCIPVISSYFVPAMMVVGQATSVQIIISLAILILSIPLTFNFCSNIFKNGILDYTKVNKKKIKKEKINNSLETFLVKRKMKNVGFVVGTSIIIYIGSQTILSLIGNFILPPLLNNFLTETDITLIMQILLQVISLGLSSGFILAYCNKKAKTNTSSKHTLLSKLKIITITLLIIFGLQVLLSAIIYPKLGLDYNITDMFEINSESNILSKIILVIALAIIPAIFEELFFRKALIDFLIPYGRNFALLFSSLLFGLIHMNLSQGLFAFIIGLIFGAIYLYTNDIKLSIFIHFINNGFAALAMILPEMMILLVTLLLLAVLFVGFIFFIITLAERKSRNKIKNFLFNTISLESFKYKYKYILTDYIFDISMILVLVMSILTENILR